jgi:hypothetical protein
MLKAQAEAIRSKFEGYSEPDIRLYAHILDSNIRQSHQYPDGSPLPWQAINKHLRGAVSFRLKDFIEIGGYWPGHSRRYKVKDEHILEHLQIADRMDAEEYSAHPKVIFETMRLNNKPPQSRINDSSRHSEPHLIRAAIEVLARNGSYAKLAAIETHVKRRRIDMGEACLRYGQSSPEYRTARGRFYNDASCRDAVRQCHPSLHSSDTYSYKPAWKAVRTGRLHVVGGGLQSASGDMKRVAYDGIYGVKNYDIESSQPFITIELLTRAGVDAAPLVNYIQTPNYKQVYGDAAGLPGSTFKRIVIALLMGAQLPPSSKSAQYGQYAILDYLAEVAADQEELEALLQALRGVVGDIAAVLKQWHGYLLKTYIPDNAIKGRYLCNAIGKHLALHELRLNDNRQKWKDIPKVAAHILQGAEGACILEMIARSDEANFTPISCEHDGFIVSAGEPDMALWEEITLRHGLGGMRLIEKDL